MLQAVLTLRDAALRNWGLMGHEAQVRLRSYILHFILRCVMAPSWNHYRRCCVESVSEIRLWI